MEINSKTPSFHRVELQHKAKQKDLFKCVNLKLCCHKLNYCAEAFCVQNIWMNKKKTKSDPGPGGEPLWIIRTRLILSTHPLFWSLTLTEITASIWWEKKRTEVMNQCLQRLPWLTVDELLSASDASHSSQFTVQFIKLSLAEPTSIFPLTTQYLQQ